MEHLADSPLLDKDGRPLSQRIQQVLYALLPRLRRQFPTLRDEAVVTELVEKAGQQITAYEGKYGPVEKLHGFAWVTLRNTVFSALRRSPQLIEAATLPTEESLAILARTPADAGSAEEIEQEVLQRELLDCLTDKEQTISIWKKAGFSSKEIAQHLGISVSSVDTTWFRVRQMLKDLLKSGRRKSDDRPL